MDARVNLTQSTDAISYPLRVGWTDGTTRGHVEAPCTSLGHRRHQFRSLLCGPRPQEVNVLHSPDGQTHLPAAADLIGIERLPSHYQTPLQRLLRVLDNVPTHVSPVQAATFLAAAAVSAQQVAGCAHDRLQHYTRSEVVDARTPVQAYFRIRTCDMTADEVLFEVASLAVRTFTDLAKAPLAAGDIDLILHAFRAVFADLLGSIDTKESPFAQGHDTVGGDLVDNGAHEQIWFQRWITAHQVHAMLNTFAAAAIVRAAQHYENGVIDATINRLTFATSLVAAFGPSRAYALCHPPAFYREVLRPSMMPPLIPTALSGKMHLEYKAYRKAVDDLLGAIDTPIAELATTQPMVALARESLLEADMAEAERHISLVWSMIGTDKSLVQGVRAQDNALGALRMIRDRRAALIAPFIRYATPSRL